MQEGESTRERVNSSVQDQRRAASRRRTCAGSTGETARAVAIATIALVRATSATMLLSGRRIWTIGDVSDKENVRLESQG